MPEEGVARGDVVKIPDRRGRTRAGRRWEEIRKVSSKRPRLASRKCRLPARGGVCAMGAAQVWMRRKRPQTLH